MFQIGKQDAESIEEGKKSQLSINMIRNVFRELICFVKFQTLQFDLFFEMQRQEAERGQAPCSLQLIVQQQEHGSNEVAKRGRRGSGATSVNNFIQKTFDILQEKKFESIVGWSEGESRGGCSFKIHNIKAFEEVVLPQYFKHSNMSSFVRQLNMYSFHKVRGDKNEFEFQHQRFVKNRPDLLPQIKRKQIDSSLNIPSIALIAHPDHQQRPNKDFEMQVEQLNIFGALHEKQKDKQKQEQIKIEEDANVSFAELESPQKQQSILRVSSNDQDLSAKLAELQEANKNLKKIKQAKSNNLKQLAVSNRLNMSNKFNKIVMSIISSKLQQDLSQVPASEGEPKYNLNNLHAVVDHIMDPSQFKSFKQYLSMVYPLFDLNNRLKEQNDD